MQLCSKKKESRVRPPGKVGRVLPGTQGQRKSSHVEDSWTLDGPCFLSDFCLCPQKHFS